MTIDTKKLREISMEFTEIISMAEGQLICVACAEGHDAFELDIDGVLSSVSGKAGIWCHSYEDAHWPCIDRNLPTIAAQFLSQQEKIAESQQALGEIGEDEIGGSVSHCPDCIRKREIALKHWKGGKS